MDLNTYDFLLASVSVVAVPEPTTWSLLLVACGAMAVGRRLQA